MIKLFITDFDGVMSDGKVLLSNGEYIKSYNTKDGRAVQILKSQGVKVGLISGYKHNQSTIDICEHLNFDYIALNAKNKVDIAKQWMDKEGIGWDQVSYIGDCDCDIALMKKSQKSACPQDAIPACHKIADVRCQLKGGQGCVREFTNYIVEYNRRWNTKITAIIPVRDGSTRCKSKNDRKFNDTCLLTKKIKLLQQVDEIDDIVISSNCERMLNLATDLGVSIHVREDKYCQNDTMASDVFVCLAKSIKNSAMLFTICPMPFVSVSTYKKMIYQWRCYPEHDSVIMSIPLHEFLNDGKGPLNYTRETHTRSQDVDNVNISVSCALSDTNVIIKNCDLMGEDPYFLKCDEITALDIDTPIDFLTCEYLDECGLDTVEKVVRYVNNTDKDKRVQLLDCTIRDGGFATNWDWTVEQVKERMQTASNTGIEFFEIGFFSEEKDCPLWRNLDPKKTKDIINEVQPKCKITAIIDCWKYDQSIPPKSETGIDIIRVSSLIHTLDKAVKTCREAKEKGYEVSLNVIRISTLGKEHIQKVLDVMELGCADILYLADSFGAMQPKTLKSFLINFIGRHYKVGFHSHTNGGIGMANVLAAIDVGVDYIDGTYHSLGKGGGNLNLVDILLYLNIHKKQVYDMNEFLDALERYSDPDERQQVLYSISGFFSVHPTLLSKISIGKTIREIFSCIQNTPIEEREFY